MPQHFLAQRGLSFRGNREDCPMDASRHEGSARRAAPDRDTFRASAARIWHTCPERFGRPWIPARTRKAPDHLAFASCTNKGLGFQDSNFSEPSFAVMSG